MLPVIAGVEGLVLTPRERELFSRLQPAGYILFTRNIADYELTRELTDEERAEQKALREEYLAEVRAQLKGTKK